MKVEKKKKKKKQEKRTVDIHLKTSKHRIGTNKKKNDDMTLGNVKMVVPTESTLSVDQNNGTEVEKKVIRRNQYIAQANIEKLKKNCYAPK